MFNPRKVPAAHPPEPGRPPGRWLALAVLCVTLLMVNLDNTVLNVALPALVRDLHATAPPRSPNRRYRRTRP